MIYEYIFITLLIFAVNSLHGKPTVMEFVTAALWPAIFCVCLAFVVIAMTITVLFTPIYIVRKIISVVSSHREINEQDF